MKSNLNNKTSGLRPEPRKPLKRLDPNFNTKFARANFDEGGQGGQCPPCGGIGGGTPKVLLFKKNRGFTLLETVIALALWLILSIGIFALWEFSTARSTQMMQRQAAFENARIAMDGIKMNFQMARRIELQTEPGTDVLRTVSMNQLQLHNNSLRWWDFRFNFNVNAAPGAAARHRLMFPDVQNYLASGIAEVRIEYVDNARMRITITTACDEPIILEGSVCVRHKEVIVN